MTQKLDILDKLRATKYHILNPGVIFLYFGHTYYETHKAADGYYIGPMRKAGRYHCFCIDKRPEMLKLGWRVYSTKKLFNYATRYYEFAYDLETIDNGDQYKNSKSYYNTITRNLKWAQENELKVEITPEYDVKEAYD